MRSLVFFYVLFFCIGASALQSTASLKFKLDQSFPAMSGPTKGVILPVQLPAGSTELWVTGVKVEMPPQYLCHSRLGLARVDGLDPDTLKMGREENRHNAKYDIEWFMGNSQGNLENQLPSGFGIKLNTKRKRQPVYTVQLQHEARDKKHIGMGEVKVSLQYHDAIEAKALGLKPLYGSAFSIVEKGRRHWAVPTGRHLYKTGVTFYSEGQSKIKVHYIQTHAHAFADWVELYDVTEGKSVWRGKATTNVKSGSLSSIETFSSVDGIELDTSHKYETRAEYNNVSGKPVDAMIQLKLYATAPVTHFVDQPFRRKGKAGQHAHH